MSVRSSLLHPCALPLSPSSAAAPVPTAQEAFELANLVGTRSIHQLLDEIRGIFVREALLRARGNISHAARVLGVTRQGVQQMIQRYDLGVWNEQLRAQTNTLELAVQSAVADQR